MTNRDIRHVVRLLPLPTAVFHILIALGEGEKHGYAVMQEVAERTDGKVRMSPGTLYGSHPQDARRGADRRVVPHAAADDDGGAITA